VLVDYAHQCVCVCALKMVKYGTKYIQYPTVRLRVQMGRYDVRVIDNDVEQ